MSSDLPLEPWKRPIPVATVPRPPQAQSDPLVTALTSQEDLSRGADQVVAARVLTNISRNRGMSLLGKMQHLTQSAQDFHKETEAVLDGIADKIATGKRKRDDAAGKHHAYYDAIIAGVDESTKVIDRLSNGPLHGDGEG